MTILFNKVIHEFDPDPKFAEYDRAQPLSVEPCDAFVMLTQWSAVGGTRHFIIVERRDVQTLIEALQRA